jgi:F0F1-type ATP synthase alpha subunit
MAGELLEFASGTLGLANNTAGVVLFAPAIAALGEPVDGAGSLPEMCDMRCLESPASDIMSRVSVHEPFPIGRGQRELIIGDRQTGKSTIAIDSIINQDDCLCVYVAVGQKASTVAQIASTLSHHGAMQTTVIVMSSADDPATLQFIAPYTGATVAEYSCRAQWFFLAMLFNSGQRPAINIGIQFPRARKVDQHSPLRRHQHDRASELGVWYRPALYLAD